MKGGGEDLRHTWKVRKPGRAEGNRWVLGGGGGVGGHTLCLLRNGKTEQEMGFRFVLWGILGCSSNKHNRLQNYTQTQPIKSSGYEAGTKQTRSGQLTLSRFNETV